ncbi:MAG: antitermination protein NusG [Xanthomonadales bacterium]|nr:antitermination protein NusG [Xanthomonadales bacterium]
MELSILNEAGVAFLLRWIHLLAGITWIGLLYYFNFVQGEYFKAADPGAKSDVIRKLVPNALWWFRWGAMFTFLSGAGLIYMKHLTGLGIMIGAALGTLMFLNVWLIIWPNQKTVIASAAQAAEGGEPMPEAAGALAKAGLASRTNTLFSIPMLFFMASSIHLGGVQMPVSSASVASLVLIFGLIIALELNGIFGKTGPFTTVRGVIHSGVALTVVLYLLAELL